MRAFDFFFLIVVASIGPMAYTLGHPAISMFAALVFLAMLAGVCLHYLVNPPPRYVLNAVTVDLNELKEKLKEEDKPEEK